MAENFDEMTKEELLEHAHELGLDVSSGLTKADIRAAIDRAGDENAGDENVSERAEDGAPEPKQADNTNQTPDGRDYVDETPSGHARKVVGEPEVGGGAVPDDPRTTDEETLERGERYAEEKARKRWGS